MEELEKKITDAEKKRARREAQDDRKTVTELARELRETHDDSGEDEGDSMTDSGKIRELEARVEGLENLTRSLFIWIKDYAEAELNEDAAAFFDDMADPEFPSIPEGITDRQRAIFSDVTGK